MTEIRGFLFRGALLETPRTGGVTEIAVCGGGCKDRVPLQNSLRCRSGQEDDAVIGERMEKRAANSFLGFLGERSLRCGKGPGVPGRRRILCEERSCADEEKNQTSGAGRSFTWLDKSCIWRRLNLKRS